MCVQKSIFIYILIYITVYKRTDIDDVCQAIGIFVSAKEGGTA